MKLIQFAYSLEGMLAHQGETYDLVNKSSWAEGEWQKEPDAYVFRHHGLWCAIVRHSFYGFLNGYVRIPKGHPWFGKTAEDLDASECCPKVHGGITWSEPGEDGDTEGWFLGFDCGHAWDYLPGMPALPFDSVNYRNFGYVHEQVLSLARQIEKAEPLPMQLNQSLN